MISSVVRTNSQEARQVPVQSISLHLLSLPLSLILVVTAAQVLPFPIRYWICGAVFPSLESVKEHTKHTPTPAHIQMHTHTHRVGIVGELCIRCRTMAKK